MFVFFEKCKISSSGTDEGSDKQVKIQKRYRRRMEGALGGGSDERRGGQVERSDLSPYQVDVKRIFGKREIFYPQCFHNFPVLGVCQLIIVHMSLGQPEFLMEKRYVAGEIGIDELLVAGVLDERFVKFYVGFTGPVKVAPFVHRGKIVAYPFQFSELVFGYFFDKEADCARFQYFPELAYVSYVLTRKRFYEKASLFSFCEKLLSLQSCKRLPQGHPVYIELF